MVTIQLEPDGKTLEFHSVRTVLAVLNKLQLRATMAIVVREGKLLTTDRKIFNGDVLMVRKVTSAG